MQQAKPNRQATLKPQNILITVKHDSSLHMKLSQSETAMEIMIPVLKGLFTIANTKQCGEVCEVSRHGNFQLFFQAMQAGKSTTQRVGKLTLVHSADNGRSQGKVATMLLNASHAVVLDHIPNLHSKGLLSAAEHVWKKILTLPEISLENDFELPPLPTSLHDFATQTLTARNDQVDVQGDSDIQIQESFAYPHQFRSTFHYNSKLISLLQGTCCQYDLSRSRGLVLNAALAWNSSRIESQWHHFQSVCAYGLWPLTFNSRGIPS